MTLAFSDESEIRIAEALKEAYNPQAALLSVLYIAQDQFQQLTPSVFDLVSSRLDLPRMFVESVASFYTMFYRRPRGRYHIQICRTLSCALNGSEKILKQLKETLEIGPGEVSPDGRFSLEEVECLALCGEGPAMMVNKTNYVHLTPQKIDRVLDRLK